VLPRPAAPGPVHGGCCGSFRLLSVPTNSVGTDSTPSLISARWRRISGTRWNASLPDSRRQGANSNWGILTLILGLLLALAESGNAGERAAGAQELPQFQEVYSLIGSNLSGVTETELNRAAVLGLVHQLRTQVILLTNAPDARPSSGDDSLTKTAVFDGAYAYARLGGVRQGTAQAFLKAFGQLQSSNKLSGLVLDLRFAAGDDYTESAKLADLFMSNEQPLLKWGDTALRSTDKTNAISLPLILLVNPATAGAAEAFVAALRSAGTGLVVGGPTAGHTHAFRQFPLSQGHKIGIAAGRIEAGKGKLLSEEGIAPDILVKVRLESEKSYLDNPFNALATGGASRPRRDESSLIRERQGEPEGENALASPNEPPPASIIQDPALARALDVLKGLAMAKAPRR